MGEIAARAGGSGGIRLGAVLTAGVLLVGIAACNGERRSADQVREDAALGEPVTERTREEPVVGAAVLPAVERYIDRCASRSQARAEMDADHEFVSTCIELLSASFRSVIERDTIGNVALRPLLEEYDRRASALEATDWDSPRHAALVREVFTSAAGLIERLAQTNHPAAPDLRDVVSEVRTAADAVRPSQPLLEQRVEVGRFFERAGEAIQRLEEADVERS